MTDCILCGKKADFTGLYFPKDQEYYGAPKEGKIRAISYPICKQCREDAPLEKVETFIEAWYVAKNN